MPSGCRSVSHEASGRGRPARASTRLARATVPTERSGAIATERFFVMRLEDRLALLTGADPHGVLDGKHEQLPVADVARTGVPEHDLLDHAHVLRLHHALDLDLRAQVDGERRASVVLGDRLLPTRA